MIPEREPDENGGQEITGQDGLKAVSPGTRNGLGTVILPAESPVVALQARPSLRRPRSRSLRSPEATSSTTFIVLGVTSSSAARSTTAPREEPDTEEIAKSLSPKSA